MVFRSSRRTAGLLPLFIGALFFLGLLPGNGPPPVRAASVTLAWDANTEAGVAGYKLYFGTASGVYTGSIDVGPQTTYTVSGVTDAATYFFTATAYDSDGRQSPYSTEVTFVSPACVLSLSSLESPTLSADGGSGTVRIYSTAQGCSWTATTGAPWMTITGGASGTGTGVASFSVPQNQAKYGRTGTITVAGQTFTVTQSGTGISIGSAPADFNGDGDPDLLWQNQTTGQLTVWLMNGTTQTQGLWLTPSAVTDTNWKIAGVADFNGDGDPDLLWQNQVTGQLTVWLMNGTTQTQGLWLTPSAVPDTNWKIAGVADFNGDGKPDIVWQNQVTGANGVWTMNGTTAISWVPFAPGAVADTNWKIVGPK